MKKFSAILLAFFFFMVFSTVSAENYQLICQVGGAIKSVDKDSIKRGMYSKAYNISTQNGFSANVKYDYSDGSGEVYRIGFFEEDGKRYFCWLDLLARWDKNGKDVYKPSNSSTTSRWEIEEGDSWEEIFEYVKRNLR